jgi:hypothetical protein
MTAPGPPPSHRTVVANISLSLDGRVAGPGGGYDMGWIVPHALSDGARTHAEHHAVPGAGRRWRPPVRRHFRELVLVTDGNDAHRQRRDLSAL